MVAGISFPFRGRRPFVPFARAEGLFSGRISGNGSFSKIMFFILTASRMLRLPERKMTGNTYALPGIRLFCFLDGRIEKRVRYRIRMPCPAFGFSVFFRRQDREKSRIQNMFILIGFLLRRAREGLFFLLKEKPPLAIFLLRSFVLIRPQPLPPVMMLDRSTSPVCASSTTPMPISTPSLTA